ncbi:MAG: polysaccharide pyruvyl transferase family protein [Acutalibacteraceae bacterium]
MANEQTYLILPGCDDTNRGDQALIWETAAVAKEAGFDGQFHMIADHKHGEQSRQIGIRSMAYILPHPSASRAQGADNRRYGIGLKIRWSLAAVRDLLRAVPVGHAFLRKPASWFLSPEQKETLRLFEQSSAAFVKGGGFLHAHGGWAETYKIYFFLYHIRLALSMGIPVYVMPNSFGPFNGILVRRMVRKTLSRCRLVYARESISRRMLKRECGIDCRVSRDLAMYLEKQSDFDAGRCLEEHGIVARDKPLVGITVRPYRFPGQPDPQERYRAYCRAITGLVVWLKEQGYRPVLIEHVYSENYHERDMLCIEEIARAVQERGQTVDVFSDLRLNCRQMKAVYGRMDYLVGTRFHSVVFALTEQVPSIAITYGGNKGSGIMRDLGLESYSVGMDAVTEEKLIRLFLDLESHAPQIRELLADHQRRIDRDYRELVQSIREVR